MKKLIITTLILAAFISCKKEVYTIQPIVATEDTSTTQPMDTIEKVIDTVYEDTVKVKEEEKWIDPRTISYTEEEKEKWMYDNFIQYEAFISGYSKHKCIIKLYEPETQEGEWFSESGITDREPKIIVYIFSVASWYSLEVDYYATDFLTNGYDGNVDILFYDFAKSGYWMQEEYLEWDHLSTVNIDVPKKDK